MTTDTAINAAGRPKPKGKHVGMPKHDLSLKIGVTRVEMNDPRLMAK